MNLFVRVKHNATSVQFCHHTSNVKGLQELSHAVPALRLGTCRGIAHIKTIIYIYMYIYIYKLNRYEQILPRSVNNYQLDK